MTENHGSNQVFRLTWESMLKGSHKETSGTLDVVKAKGHITLYMCPISLLSNSEEGTLEYMCPPSIKYIELATK